MPCTLIGAGFWAANVNNLKNNIMKVRIIKSQKPNYWYVNEIGKCFDVLEYGDKDYSIPDGGLIAKDDCEIVTETKDDKLFTAAVAAMQGYIVISNFGDTYIKPSDVATEAWDFAEALIKEGKERKHL